MIAWAFADTTQQQMCGARKKEKKQAKEQAKESKKQAIIDYLEAKNIKKTYEFKHRTWPPEKKQYKIKKKTAGLLHETVGLMTLARCAVADLRAAHLDTNTSAGTRTKNCTSTSTSKSTSTCT